MQKVYNRMKNHLPTKRASMVNVIKNNKQITRLPCNIASKLNQSQKLQVYQQFAEYLLNQGGIDEIRRLNSVQPSANDNNNNGINSINGINNENNNGSKTNSCNNSTSNPNTNTKIQSHLENESKCKEKDCVRIMYGIDATNPQCTNRSRQSTGRKQGQIGISCAHES